MVLAIGSESRDHATNVETFEHMLILTFLASQRLCSSNEKHSRFCYKVDISQPLPFSTVRFRFRFLLLSSLCLFISLLRRHVLPFPPLFLFVSSLSFLFSRNPRVLCGLCFSFSSPFTNCVTSFFFCLDALDMLVVPEISHVECRVSASH